MFLAAARVGGIFANDTRPAEFLYDNLMIESERHRGRAPRRRREAAVPGLVLHLSAAGAAADPRGRAAHRAARADQPVVCDRQDRRHQARPGLSPAVRLRLHLGHADQPLRAGRQFRPHAEPRRAGADGQGARRHARARAGHRGLGHRRGAARVPLRRRCRRRHGLPDAELFRRGDRQSRARLGRGRSSISST